MSSSSDARKPLPARRGCREWPDKRFVPSYPIPRNPGVDPCKRIRRRKVCIVSHGRKELNIEQPEAYPLSSQPEITHQLLSSIRAKLVSIYAQVYMYQIRFVLQYARGKVHRALRNTVSTDGWKQMWSEIESASRFIDQSVQDRLGARGLETWRRVNDIEARAERIESLQQATLAAVQVGDPKTSTPFAVDAEF